MEQVGALTGKCSSGAHAGVQCRQVWTGSSRPAQWAVPVFENHQGARLHSGDGAAQCGVLAVDSNALWS
jgi:hypothetical protein